MADNHAIYKNGAKEIAHLNGCSITFMAKPDHTWIGNSCHIHSSLWRDGENAVRRRERRLPALPRRLDRVPARAGALPRAERQLVQALRSRLLGADDARLGPRQPHLRLPHRRPRPVAARRDADPRRRRQPVPRLRGADRGRAARDRARLELPPPLEGNAYESDAERFPHALREAIAALEGGTMARERARRRGRRPLPELRAHRAAALRRGRHLLGARAAVRARMRAARSGSRRTSRRRVRGDWEEDVGARPGRLRARGRARRRAAAARAAEHRRGRGDARRARRADLLRRLRPRPGALRQERAPGDRRERRASATRRARAARRRRSRATCRCSRSAAARSC